ncbi:MAG: heavy metal-binding domain-containing protein [Acidimicrobiia bacterium]
MPDESAVPEFSLPDWGTEGAPPEPSVPADADADADLVEIAVERPMLLVAGALPSRWNVRTVHGLVTAFGKSEKDDHLDAVESATAKALDDLSEKAQAMGANAVVDVDVAVSGRKSKVVVTAWGTAVSFSR